MPLLARASQFWENTNYSEAATRHMSPDSKSSPLIVESPGRTVAGNTDPSLRGSVLVLIQFDVCEEIRLDELRQIFGARTLQQPSLKHPAPGYVRYQRPPVVEPIEALVLDSSER